MILALDISTVTGFALHGPEGVRYGTWALNPDDWARAHNQLEDRIELVCRDHCVRTLVVERPFGRGRQRDMMQWLSAAAHGAGYAHSLARRDVSPSTWRKALWGRGNWSTKAAKAKALEWCRAQGFDPSNDHEADAICLLSWALQTGEAAA